MKSLVIIAVIFGVALAWEHEEFRKFTDQCSGETGINWDTFVKYREHQIPTDDKLKKHLLCVYTKMGIMTQDGHFDKDKIKEKLSKHITDEKKIDELMRKCTELKDTAEESALHYGRCIKRNIEDHDEFKKLTEECSTETGVDWQLLGKYHRKEIPTDEKLKKHLVCVFKREGVMDEQGNLIKEKIKERCVKRVDDDKKVEDFLKECVVQKQTPEETAFEYSKCVKKHTHF